MDKKLVLQDLDESDVIYKKLTKKMNHRIFLSLFFLTFYRCFVPSSYLLFIPPFCTLLDLLIASP